MFARFQRCVQRVRLSFFLRRKEKDFSAACSVCVSLFFSSSGGHTKSLEMEDETQCGARGGGGGAGGGIAPIIVCVYV